MTRSAVIFDLDGTITKPNLDFDAIRREIGVQGPILEALDSLGPADRTRAEAILDRYEQTGAEQATLQDGAVETIDACRERGFAVAILTRNARKPVQTVLQRFSITIDALRTRQDGAIKPSHEPVLSICKELDASPQQSWMVGDYLFDILSGKTAETKTILMHGDDPRPDFADQADYVINRLPDLLQIIGDAT